ncbi:Aste57867_12243 [Aphanomyces stellatus]|uniref:Aste57867_12243 protein n=1 Tax=Aphanomyces stellatus TaxID=120398 RepID=A0A485KVU0_9STRA|nr:hypothetical protein As57867_012198 [Aphanomyces stellatus]VFT89097.1 Aste57867_12243 [Aphanomyces stellatus]
MPAATFPVPQHFFRCPPLSSEDTARYLRQARDNVVDLVDHASIHGGPLTWTLESDTNGMQIYAAHDINLPSHVLSYMGVVDDIPATLDEVASLFQTHTRDLYDDFRRHFATDLIDGRQLYTLQPPSPTHPHESVGLKWTVNEMPSRVVRHRDWCFLESAQMIHPEGRRRGWARAVYSTTLRCCPDLEAALGVVRGTFYRSGHVFMETDRPGHVRGVMLFQAALNGGFQARLIPSWLVKLGVRRRIRGLARVQSYVREMRLAQGGILQLWEVVPTATRTRCFLCAKRFGSFARKVSCRKCGEVVCHGCSNVYSISLDGVVTPVRACSPCSMGPYQALAPAGKPMAATSANDESSAGQDEDARLYSPADKLSMRQGNLRHEESTALAWLEPTPLLHQSVVPKSRRRIKSEATVEPIALKQPSRGHRLTNHGSTAPPGHDIRGVDTTCTSSIDASRRNVSNDLELVRDVSDDGNLDEIGSMAKPIMLDDFLDPRLSDDGIFHTWR